MNVLAALLLIAVLVFIHEFGHFALAKLCGVQVTVFSIGFGRRVAGFEHKGTDYRLSLLPFGGYVRMAGSDPFGWGDEDDHLLEDPDSAFLRRPVWQRLLVVSAGPAANLVLPVVVFTSLLMAGEPQLSPVVGRVSEGSPAEAAGLMTGDRILSIDGEPTPIWIMANDVAKRLQPGPHTVLIRRGDAELSLQLQVTTQGAMSTWGMIHSRPGPWAGVDDPESPAGKAGMQSGDEIVAISGVAVGDWLEIQRELRDPPATLEITYRRIEGEGPDAREEERTALIDTTTRYHPSWASELPGPDEALGLLSGMTFVGLVQPELDDASGGFLAGCRPDTGPRPSPAYEAGFRTGDRFLTMDGKRVETWQDVLDGVKATMSDDSDQATARSLELELVRAGEVIHLTVEPQVVKDTNAQGRYETRARLGVGNMSWIVDGPEEPYYYGFLPAVERALDETLLVGGYILDTLAQLVTGDAPVSKNVGGPVEIFRQASKAFDLGLFQYARMLGMLSLSLGIVNFLPVPVLDGGQFLFYAIEGIRGRPLSLALRERAQQIGVLLLVLAMLSVLVMDIHKAIFGS